MSHTKEEWEQFARTKEWAIKRAQDLAAEVVKLKQQRDDLLAAARRLLCYSKCDADCNDRQLAEENLREVVAKGKVKE